MAYDYDKLYRVEKHALGKINADILSFFTNLTDRSLTVLDVGCGQGRDAIEIAKLGHHVTGVDISPAGIEDFMASAHGLDVKGVVADITTFMTSEDFDIIVIDRTLHMLKKPERFECFERLLGSLKPLGFLLLIDEPSNMSEFRKMLKASEWKMCREKSGLLFAQFRAPLSATPCRD